ncbi:MAG: fumarylacetoacetate hydrolase family protein, partial [Solirubrobacterales bacterium]
AALVDGDVVRPLQGIVELGDETPIEVLSDPPVGREELPLADVRLRPLIPRPSKIVCIGLNYKAHVDEGVYDVPDYPALFIKFPDALIAAGEPITIPPESTDPDFEAELAFVIGRRVRRVSRDDAPAAVAGYTVANDITMRDYQYRTHQWLPGKTWPGTTPLGPFLVTPDELSSHVARLLTPHKRPREVRFIDALPRNEMGKVRKPDLPRGS